MIKIAFPVIFQGFTGFTCLLNIANDEELAPAFDERILRTLETATLSLWRERSNLSSRSIFSYLGYRYCGCGSLVGEAANALRKLTKLNYTGAERSQRVKLFRNLMFAYCSRAVNSSHVLAMCELLNGRWPGTESNRRRRPFQGRLPNRRSGLKSTDLGDYNELTPVML